MSVTILELTPHDAIVARDGRPFGVGQGARMRGLGWPLPSVVAGSLRTALVKAESSLDFSGNTPDALLRAEVAGVLPVADGQLYFPSPADAVVESTDETTERIHRAYPPEPDAMPAGEGCDFPVSGLRPVMLRDEQAAEEFKPKNGPAWWPCEKFVDWLTPPSRLVSFDDSFLNAPISESRDHVCLDPDTGAAKEGLLYATAGLHLTHLSRYGAKDTEPFAKKFAPIALSARVTLAGKTFDHVANLNTWHPLGGERRLVHWRATGATDLWSCPAAIEHALAPARRVRMVLVTPAIFADGWRPGWVDAATLEARPFANGPMLKLVGVSIARWRAVSGWSMQPHAKTGKPGPKPVRRMVPAGGVYFFELADQAEDATLLATSGWLRSVSDDAQDRGDGFGLAVWGVW